MPEVDPGASDEDSHFKTRTKPPQWGTKLSEHTPVISPGGEKIRCRSQQQPCSPSTDTCFINLTGTKYEGYNLSVEIRILVDSKITRWSDPAIPLSKQEIQIFEKSQDFQKSQDFHKSQCTGLV